MGGVELGRGRQLQGYMSGIIKLTMEANGVCEV